jgi:hypothetical protein
MNYNFTLKLNHMLKKIIVCATMMGIVFIALASSGGGKKKSSGANVALVPVKSNGTLNLKTRPAYSGSHFMRSETSRDATVYRSLIAYKQGNTTYLVPSKYRMNNSSRLSMKSGLSGRSNLNMIDLKIRLSK